MHVDLQTFVVLAILAAALGYLCRQAWLTFFKKKPGGCGSCSSGGCATSASPGAKAVISISLPQKQG